MWALLNQIFGLRVSFFCASKALRNHETISTALLNGCSSACPLLLWTLAAPQVTQQLLDADGGRN